MFLAAELLDSSTHVGDVDESTQDSVGDISVVRTLFVAVVKCLKKCKCSLDSTKTDSCSY